MRIKCLILVLLCLISKTGLPQCTTLMSFGDPGGTSKGDEPLGGLTLLSEYLYGTTFRGGVNNLGTIFRIKKDGSDYGKLYDFNGPGNGKSPRCSLTFDGAYLYGTTFDGGSNQLGTVFRIKPNGTGFLKLLDFNGTTSGSGPFSYVLPVAGVLYGTTNLGGTNAKGTVFRVDTNGNNLIKLRDFSGPDGEHPASGLTFDGVYLYGTTNSGGSFNCGTVFRIKPDGSSFTKLMDMGGINSGCGLFFGVTLKDNFLFGITTLGGNNNSGTIFRLKTDGSSFSKLYDFNDPITGSQPNGNLALINGFLYGTNRNGGSQNIGTLFRVDTAGNSFSKLFNFNIVNGASPLNPVITDGISLYGITPAGGANSTGVVYRFETPLSVSENFLSDQFSIYPNPAKEFLNFNTSLNLKLEIEIYSSIGEQLGQRQALPEQIDISNLNPGLYLLRIISDRGAFYKKFIKQH